MPHERKADIAASIAADGSIKIYRNYLVVKEIEEKEEERQMLLKEAKKIKREIKEGETLTLDITPDPLDFTRI